MINIIEINKNELKEAHKMHRKCFVDTFKRYRDKKNPVFMSYKKFKKYESHPKLTMYWIVKDDIRVGQIWIGVNESSAMLSRIFVLKEYQNQGIAQEAIKLAESKYSHCTSWYLDTIKQEKNNCHLYEKMGYIKTDEEMIINKRMTIIYYKKELG